MIDRFYDVVVVGAGPAGSVAAKVFAERGLKTLVLEKRQEIGAPKRCAEGINVTALRGLGLEPDPRWAVHEIKGAVLYAPSGRCLEVKSGNVLGYVLERKMFEKFLAFEAIRRGAKYMVKTTATGVVKEEGKVCGVEAVYMGEEFTVDCRLVVAADGVDSKIARTAGLNTVNSMADYHSGFQYEMAGLHLSDPEVLHIFFGEKIAPKGYVWIFPKGGDVANVGVGVLGRLSDRGCKARDFLDGFIDSRPEIFRDASPVEINTGGIPVGSTVDCMTADGLMVVGDAAHQVNPIHGGGIALAMNAGRLAAEVGVKALAEGDVSQNRLSEYEVLWKEGYGSKLERLLKLRNFMEKLEDCDLEKMCDVLSGEDVMRLTEGEYNFLINRFIKKAPKILPLARKFLT